MGSTRKNSRGTTSVKTGYKKVLNAGVHQAKIEVPKYLHFIADDNIAEYDHFLPRTEHRKYDLYVYKYTKSSTKLGRLLPLKEQEINDYRNSFNVIANNDEGRRK